MSVEAITWALKETVNHSSAKFVLVVLANCASSETLEAYPSVKYISEATSQDRKTVLSNLKRLIESGHIFDTGKRVGSTSQVVVYGLNCAGNGSIKESQIRNSTEFGTVPFFPAKSTVFPVKESRFSMERVPKTGHGTVIEPSIEPSIKQQVKKSISKNQVQKPGEVDQSVWDDFLLVRKSKKSPLTSTALKMLVAEVTKSGKSLNDALMVCCQRGWQTYKADWDTQASSASLEKTKDLPLGTDQQIEHAYRVECGADPSKARFNSYFEMRKFIQDFREKNRKLAA